MKPLKYTTQITLYNSYFDQNNNLSAKSILSIFQDVASIHAEEIGIGYEQMLKQNIYWMLSRVRFDIKKQPTLNQVVIVETWPHQKGRIDFDGDMKISSLDGETLIVAQSKWCVIDTINRMLQRTDNINYNGECLPNKNYEDKFVKVSLPEQEPTYKYSHNVSFCDLDHNGHMNNTNYANLVLDTIHNKLYNHFEINFVSECLENDKIDIYYTNNENGEYVVGKNADKVAFVAYAK